MNSAKISFRLGAGASILYFLLTSICIATPANRMLTNIEKTIPSDNHATSNILYALSADSGTFNNNKLTLNGVKRVIYFTDAPKRTAGQISPEKFDKIWNMTFITRKSKAPNAVLSLLGKDGNNNVVIELQSQNLEGDTLSYNVNILEGNPDKSFRSATLFIDGFPCRVNGC